MPVRRCTGWGTGGHRLAVLFPARPSPPCGRETLGASAVIWPHAHCPASSVPFTLPARTATCRHVAWRHVSNTLRSSGSLSPSSFYTLLRSPYISYRQTLRFLCLVAAWQCFICPSGAFTLAVHTLFLTHLIPRALHSPLPAGGWAPVGRSRVNSRGRRPRPGSGGSRAGAWCWRGAGRVSASSLCSTSD